MAMKGLCGGICGVRKPLQPFLCQGILRCPGNGWRKEWSGVMLIQHTHWKPSKGAPSVQQCRREGSYVVMGSDDPKYKTTCSLGMGKNSNFMVEREKKSLEILVCLRRKWPG
ncbi:unnamed protein product [Lepidochelys olivacea]